MDAGSCLSDSGVSAFRLGIGRRSAGVVFEAPQKEQRSQSQAIVRSPSFAGTETGSTTKSTGGGNKPRMAHLQTLEAKVS